MPSLVVYTFIQGYPAPLSIHWGGRRLYDRAALERVWAACRAELEADRWQVPAGLEETARHELER
jgi:hypothetical protein